MVRNAFGRVLSAIAIAGGPVVASLWLWTTVTPGDDLARLRNSVGVRVGEVSDFTWEPGASPSTFLANRGAVPNDVRAIARTIPAGTPDERGDGLGVGFAIARDLMRADRQVGGGLRTDFQATYRAITTDGRGYCADFVKTFTGLALAADVPVRQWGFAFTGFGSGHTFNEVFDLSRGKWVMIDSFHSLYFTDRQTGEPLSVLEVHDRLLGISSPRLDMDVVRIVADRFPFRSDQAALNYYRDGMSQLWLVWGTNLFDYESSLAGRIEKRVHRAVGQALGMVSGRYPAIVVYPVGLSGRDMDELLEARREFAMALGAWVASLLLSGYALAQLRSDGSRRATDSKE